MKNIRIGLIKMSENELTWKEVRKSLNIKPEEEAAIQFEKDIMKRQLQQEKRISLSKEN